MCGQRRLYAGPQLVGRSGGFGNIAISVWVISSTGERREMREAETVVNAGILICISVFPTNMGRATHPSRCPAVMGEGKV